LEKEWLDFFEYSMDLAAANIDHICSKYENELLQVDKDIVAMILDKAIQ